MKRTYWKSVVFTAVFLLPLIFILLSVVKARNNRKIEDQQFVKRAEDAFAKWKKDHSNQMVSVGSVNFQSFLSKINSDTSLSPQQKQKLLSAVSGFYGCYAEGSFDRFLTYRLGLPFDLDTNVVANLIFCLPKNHRLSDKKTELLEDLWKYYVSTNRVLKVDPDSIKITVEVATDRRQGIYFKATNYVTDAAVGYLPKVVVVHPTAKEIFQRDKKVLHATVEQFVVTSADPNSVCPLFISYYWVEELGDWLLYEVARISGDFRIIY